MRELKLRWQSLHHMNASRLAGKWWKPSRAKRVKHGQGFDNLPHTSSCEYDVGYHPRFRLNGGENWALPGSGSIHRLFASNDGTNVDTRERPSNAHDHPAVERLSKINASTTKRPKLYNFEFSDKPLARHFPCPTGVRVETRSLHSSTAVGCVEIQSKMEIGRCCCGIKSEKFFLADSTTTL